MLYIKKKVGCMKFFSVEKSEICLKRRTVVNIFGIKLTFGKYLMRKLDDEYNPHPPVYLSIAAILKNEAPYIKEWIEYHKLVGVERFYLYNNESDDDVEKILEKYIKDGTVIYKYVKGKSMQIPVYSDAICKYKNETKWMAFIDLDEYLVPVEKDSIAEFLKDYENYPGVVVNWQPFDSNGHKKAPKGLVIENYTRRRRDELSDRCVKSIVNPREVKYIFNPHCFSYLKGKLAVNEAYEKQNNDATAVTKNLSINKIRLNHYHCKSQEEYAVKISKECADIARVRPYSEEAVNFKDENAVYDDTILRFLPKLKEKMKD